MKRPELEVVRGAEGRYLGKGKNRVEEKEQRERIVLMWSTSVGRWLKQDKRRVSGEGRDCTVANIEVRGSNRKKQIAAKIPG